MIAGLLLTGLLAIGADEPTPVITEKEWKDNPVEVITKLKGKVVQITGKVSSIHGDDEKASINIRFPEIEESPFNLTAILATMKDPKDVIGLRPGDTVVIKGVLQGKARFGDGLNLDQVKIVKTEKAAEKK